MTLADAIARCDRAEIAGHAHRNCAAVLVACASHGRPPLLRWCTERYYARCSLWEAARVWARVVQRGDCVAIRHFAAAANDIAQHNVLTLAIDRCPESTLGAVCGELLRLGADPHPRDAANHPVLLALRRLRVPNTVLASYTDRITDPHSSLWFIHALAHWLGRSDAQTNCCKLLDLMTTPNTAAIVCAVDLAPRIRRAAMGYLLGTTQELGRGATHSHATAIMAALFRKGRRTLVLLALTSDYLRNGCPLDALCLPRNRRASIRVQDLDLLAAHGVDMNGTCRYGGSLLHHTVANHDFTAAAYMTQRGGACIAPAGATHALVVALSTLPSSQVPRDILLRMFHPILCEIAATLTPEVSTRLLDLAYGLDGKVGPISLALLHHGAASDMVAVEEQRHWQRKHRPPRHYRAWAGEVLRGLWRVGLPAELGTHILTFTRHYFALAVEEA